MINIITIAKGEDEVLIITEAGGLPVSHNDAMRMRNYLCGFFGVPTQEELNNPSRIAETAKEHGGVLYENGVTIEYKPNSKFGIVVDESKE